MNYLIYSMYALMFLFLGALAVGCGDSRGIAIETNGQYQPVNHYEQCLRNNSNYCGSPAWFYWVNDCKRRFNVNTPYNPPCPYISSQPYPNDR